MADTVEEQQWIRDSLAGNDAAYALLVGRYQQMIHAVTYRMTGSFSDAEDLAQDTFVRAFHELKHFRGEAKFSTWLCRIAMNLSLNWRSREGRRSEVHNRWADDAYSQPAHSAEQGETDAVSEKVQAALNRLPAKQRAAMVLTVYEGLNHAEAARALGCSEATISWRVFAARNKLKRWLAPAVSDKPGG
jgi:RNA polymerase sigma-70 factor (ECF subfamily)